MKESDQAIKAKKFAAQSAKTAAKIEARLFKDIPDAVYKPKFKALHKLYPLTARY